MYYLYHRKHCGYIRWLPLRMFLTHCQCKSTAKAVCNCHYWTSCHGSRLAARVPLNRHSGLFKPPDQQATALRQVMRKRQSEEEHAVITAWLKWEVQLQNVGLKALQWTFQRIGVWIICLSVNGGTGQNRGLKRFSPHFYMMHSSYYLAFGTDEMAVIIYGSVIIVLSGRMSRWSIFFNGI